MRCKTNQCTSARVQEWIHYLSCPVLLKAQDLLTCMSGSKHREPFHNKGMDVKKIIDINCLRWYE